MPLLHNLEEVSGGGGERGHGTRGEDIWTLGIRMEENCKGSGWKCTAQKAQNTIPTWPPPEGQYTQGANHLSECSEDPREDYCRDLEDPRKQKEKRL